MNLDCFPVAVDTALITALDGALWTLLIRRQNEPFAGSRAIPGGLVARDESLDDAAERVLREKTGVSGIFTEQLYSFGEVDRDPRGRTITIAYFALVHASRFRRACAANKSLNVARLEVPWEGETGGPVSVSARRLSSTWHSTTIGFWVPRSNACGEAQLHAHRFSAAARDLHAEGSSDGTRDDSRSTAQQGFLQAPHACLR